MRHLAKGSRARAVHLLSQIPLAVLGPAPRKRGAGPNGSRTSLDVWRRAGDFEAGRDRDRLRKEALPGSKSASRSGKRAKMVS
ncbi:MAG: hypothetical protein HRU33_15740 [Rhodobacteraceae bacterium]|nr:hypothetical protein [Paracoccaceae bacterium]